MSGRKARWSHGEPEFLAWDARQGPGGHEVGFDRTTDQHIGRAIHVVDVILREKWRHPAGLSRWISFIGTRDAEKGRRTSSQGGVGKRLPRHQHELLWYGCQVQAQHDGPFFSVPGTEWPWMECQSQRRRHPPPSSCISLTSYRCWPQFRACWAR